MEDFKVDVVVPYVDWSDPIWIKNAKKNNVDLSTKVRWRGQGDFFRYFFRCIAKNLPWINNLFLIVQSKSQVPKWIDQTKIKVILHKDFIPKKYLPVYNSCTIEMFIQNIEELSEHILYFNDDIFVKSYLDKSDFFGQNNVYQHYLYEKFPESDNAFYSNMKNGYKLIFNDENHCGQEHTIKALLKSKMIECFDKYKSEITQSITKFRDKKNFNIYLFGYYLKKLNLVLDSKIYFKMMDNYDDIVLNGLSEIICINDNINDINVYEHPFILEWFEDNFPEKCIYEKD